MPLVVISGGVRSGKSRAAQELALTRAREGAAVRVAVFASASDREMTARIDAHRESRPPAFEVVEAAGGGFEWVADSHAKPGVLLIDCLGTCLGQSMLSAWKETAAAGLDMSAADILPDGFETAFVARVDSLVDAIASRPGDTIVVTNEVGFGVVPAFATGRIFRDELGRANRMLTDVADAAYLVVSGRLLDLTALPRAIAWPED